ncbi:MFS transporter [Tessaracoccus sp. MC1756]|uniref:MFS transporter n=1 Tax=Tessaracoccus sp. MC1756 TaxID=2760311 RepID=UPI0016033D7B|nr:glycoside-pentoside-hexuronide (GPH):cation symporter [Tessaracoccus sp. MC1756]MBB1508292.1 MFS transporter [Tessaracoccus sp. MC1756]
MSISTQNRTVRPFGWRDKIGYLFGDFGNDFTFMLQMMFFMVFYTDVMGINPAHVGLLFLLARLLDAFTDVGMGRLVDVLKPSSSGRFKPWILRIAIPVALAGAMMFMPFAVDASYAVRVIYMCVTYVVWGSVFYTMINIPYGSMAAVISNNPEHRASLSVFRSVGAQLAFLLISAVLPQVVFVQNANGVDQLDPTRMALAAVACAIAAVACYALCYFNVEERVQSILKPKDQQASFGQMLGTLTKNRPLIALVIGAIVFLIGNQIASTTTAYLWKDYFNNGGMMSTAQIVAIAPVFIIALVATRLAMKFGKKEMIGTMLAVSGLLSIVMWIMKISNPWLFIALFFVLSIGVAMYNTLVWAVITDVLDYQEIKTGERDDGTVYAIYSWSRKLGQAAAGYVVGWAVGSIGYSSEAAQAGVQQSLETKNGIYLLFLLVPGILYLITSAIMLFWYPLGRRQVMDNFQTLRARAAAVEPDSAQSVDPAAADVIPAASGVTHGETGARRGNIANDPRE